MKKMKTTLILCAIVSSFLLAGCTSSTPLSEYQGDSVPFKGLDVTIESDLDPVLFGISGTGISSMRMSLINNTNEDIYIEWNKCQLESDEKVSRVTFKAQDYSDAEASMRDSKMVPGKTWNVTLVPVKTIELIEEDWYVKPLPGKKFLFTLAFRQGDVSYVKYFRIEDVKKAKEAAMAQKELNNEKVKKAPSYSGPEKTESFDW